VTANKKQKAFYCLLRKHPLRAEKQACLVVTQVASSFSEITTVCLSHD